MRRGGACCQHSARAHRRRKKLFLVTGEKEKAPVVFVTHPFQIIVILIFLGKIFLLCTMSTYIIK